MFLNKCKVNNDQLVEIICEEIDRNIEHINVDSFDELTYHKLHKGILGTLKYFKNTKFIDRYELSFKHENPGADNECFVFLMRCVMNPVAFDTVAVRYIIEKGE